MSATAQLNAALAGRYRIDRRIGQGGMATVYLAHDLRHQRPVALKVLSPELGAVLGTERFLAEIRVTANLQHPNLLPLFDSGEADGLLFYVMPYVEGESLRARLTREKQLPIDDAVRLGVAVAGALDYAHRHRVIHRDLKPENILLHEGQPLIADFGIALAISNAGGSRVTQTGISLGTPQYMSPEQATGDRDLDGRSDIYSLGAVIYEMLAGEPPHSGTTAQAVIAKVLTDRPRKLHLSRDTVPPHVEDAVETALAKLPADRWATAQQFADALRSPTAAPMPRSGAPPRAIRSVSARSRFRDPLILALALIALLASGVAIWQSMPRPRDQLVTRLSLAIPQQVLATPAGGVAIAVSRDGRTMVYNGFSPSGTFVLYVRRFDDLEPRALPGSGLSLDPSISPNGRWVAYNAGSQLYRQPIDGGPAVTLGRASLSGTAWLDDSHIIVSNENRLQVYPTDGGKAESLTTLDRANGERNHVYPVVSPDGRYVFYQSISASGFRIGVVNVKTHQQKILNVDGISAMGVIDNALIYATMTGALMAVPLDFANLRADGDAIPLNVTVNVLGSGVARAGLSATGTLIYQTGSITGRLMLADEKGTMRPLLGDPKPMTMPRFAPDGRRLSVGIDQDVWIYDIASATPTRLTTVGRNDRSEWTPDGKRVLYRTTREGVQDLWWQPADGSGSAERLLRLDDGPEEGVVSPDGKWLILRNVGITTRRDIWYAALGDSAPTLHPIATSEFEEMQPRMSRDGKLVAYMSNESGQFEVYVREFPGPSGKVQVSLGGGMAPVFGVDSRTLFYQQGNRLMRATLTAMRPPAVLSRAAVLEGDLMASPIHANYDVSPDGKSFAVVVRSGPDVQVIVVQNWAREVRKRLRGR
jgi:serine/threonine protein kinase/Tol biopolymer transport system component